MSLTRNIDYLNFDSLYSVDALNDCFDSTFILMHKYTNIKNIYLKNAGGCGNASIFQKLRRFRKIK